MIVSKAVKMAELMDVKVLGIIENMSYVKCPHCDEKIKLYGESHIEEIAGQYGLEVLGRLPVDPELASQVDKGVIELYNKNYLDKAAEKILAE